MPPRVESRDLSFWNRLVRKIKACWSFESAKMASKTAKTSDSRDLVAKERADTRRRFKTEESEVNYGRLSPARVLSHSIFCKCVNMVESTPSICSRYYSFNELLVQE